MKRVLIWLAALAAEAFASLPRVRVVLPRLPRATVLVALGAMALTLWVIWTFLAAAHRETQVQVNEAASMLEQRIHERLNP